MKKIITVLMAATAIFIFGKNAEAQQYALHYLTTDAPALSDGDTVDYTIAEWEYDLGITSCNIFIENLTESNLLTTQEVSIVEGPSSLAPDLCAGGNCPWNGQPYELVPGVNTEMPLTIEVPLSSNYTGSLLLKVVVGNSNGLANNTTAYIRMQLGNNGINSADMPETIKTYPNPTTGTVNVGGVEYDLSSHPAGVYYIPYGNSAARVIKL